MKHQTGKEGVDLAAELLPDVILMDLVMDGMDGIEATKQICAKLNDPKIIVLTSFIDDDKVYPVIEAGALSYLLKTSKAAEIAEAIRAVAKGEPKLESKVAGKVLSRLRHSENQLPHETLTKRELEILCLVAEGKTNKEIGEELFITIKTVKTHITNILSKLDVSDRTQAYCICPPQSSRDIKKGERRRHTLPRDGVIGTFPLFRNS